MIKTSELREGNYVNVVGKNSFNISGIIRVEDVISNCGINLHHDHWLHDLKDIEAIPITDEWLSRIKWDNSLFQITDFTVIVFSFGSFWINIAGNSNKKPRRIEFIHQLQNLYFTLTGEELIISI